MQKKKNWKKEGKKMESTLQKKAHVGRKWRQNQTHKWISWFTTTVRCQGANRGGRVISQAKRQRKTHPLPMPNHAAAKDIAISLYHHGNHAAHTYGSFQQHSLISHLYSQHSQISWLRWQQDGFWNRICCTCLSQKEKDIPRGGKGGGVSRQKYVCN